MSDVLKILAGVVFGCTFFGLGWLASRESPGRAMEHNPFKSVGHISTANGLLVEVYRMRHEDHECIIAVQMIPSEPGRAGVEMECR